MILERPDIREPVLLSRDVPEWVTVNTRRYLAHIVAGYSIRVLARDAGVHASTILRQIRRMETRRDDPLIDAALTTLALLANNDCAKIARKDNGAMICTLEQPQELPDSATLEREASRILRRLCETGAVLAVAEQMEKAVVVRDTGAGGESARTAVVDRSIARAMALQDWISCASPGRISRYRITSAGRAAVGQMLADAENRARSDNENGFGEAPARFVDASAVKPGQKRLRYNAAESPLSALARRKDRDGKPFLDAGQVQAGERLREDFELAQMDQSVTLNWDQFLVGGSDEQTLSTGGTDGCSKARDRMARALGDLGQGLSDVALRCCCYLEGLEEAEKRMGWSARSGKIVLRIALQRLRQHYDGLTGSDRMIG